MDANDMTVNYFNDSPITSPSEDEFGMDHFARALARSFSELSGPVGSTIALNGPWGSGKSSAVNLIRHHLRPLQDDDKLIIIDFQCWWFRGEEALTLAFLQTLYGALKRTIGDKVKDLIPKIGKKLLQAGPVVGSAINLTTGGVWGSLVGNSVDFAKRFFSDEDPIEVLFQRLSALLARQEKRFLVIIDDVDRLTPDEALLILRLVKSVGRLPNVMYLLAFDRELAEKIVKERYPSEGPHFLEKIIQGNFELPLPARDELESALLSEIGRCCGSPHSEGEMRRFMNIFYDGVSPYLHTPRDLVRISNAIAVSWAPVAQEVNLADFVALEVIRIFEPALYKAIRGSKGRLCGVRSAHDREDPEKELEKLLVGVSETRRDHARDTLIRLFPRLENVGYGPGFLQQWEAERLVCTERHFDTYFRMAIGDETISINEIDELVEHSGDPGYVKNAFRQALTSIRKSGKSKVPLLLDELSVHAPRIDKQNLQPLISAVFEIADDIDREEDKEQGFSIGTTHLRMHWLIRRLTFERCDLKERSGIFLKACQNAQLAWLVDFTVSAIGDHYPREGEQPQPPEKCLVQEDHVGVLRAHTMKMIEDAAASGRVIGHAQLGYILFRWRDFSEDDGSTVKAWTNGQLANDISVALFARAFTSQSWSQGMGMFGLGDRVAIRHIQAAVGNLESIMDVETFRRRLEGLEAAQTLAEPYKSYVDTFLEAWRKRDRGEGHE